MRKAIAAGKASWVEYDENGRPAYDHGKQLGEKQYEQEQVLSEISSAAASRISLRHFALSLVTVCTSTVLAVVSIVALAEMVASSTACFSARLALK